jgi:hypothetical protein
MDISVAIPPVPNDLMESASPSLEMIRVVSQVWQRGFTQGRTDTLNKILQHLDNQPKFVDRF